MILGKVTCYLQLIRSSSTRSYRKWMPDAHDFYCDAWNMRDLLCVNHRESGRDGCHSYKQRVCKGDRASVKNIVHQANMASGCCWNAHSLFFALKRKKNVSKCEETNTRTYVSGANCNTSGDVCLL